MTNAMNHCATTRTLETIVSLQGGISTSFHAQTLRSAYKIDIPASNTSLIYFLKNKFAITNHLPPAMDYDYTQKWSDLQESMKKPTRTPEEEKKHKERKAHELRVMLERAEVALEGNKKYLGKGRPKATKIREIGNSDWYFRR